MPWHDLSYHDLETILHGPRPDGARPYLRRRRRLSRSFLDAPSLDRLYQLTPDDYLSDLWVRYVQRCKDRKLLLWSQEEHRYATLPYIYRGHPEYRLRQGIKMDILANNWPTRVPGCLLTISPRRTGSPLDTLWAITTNLNRFFSWLTSRKRGNRCQYLWALESTDSGNPHIHIILATRWVAPIDDIIRWWQGAGADISSPGVDVRPIHTAGEVSKYVSKYIRKGLSDPRWMALLHLTGRRQWGGSWSLTRPSNLPPRHPLIPYKLVLWACSSDPPINSNSKWTFLGSFHSQLIIDMLDGHEKPPDPDIYTDKEGRKHNIFSDFARLIDCSMSHIATGMDGPRKKWRPN